jgi:excisionase family DNA binding protein
VTADARLLKVPEVAQRLRCDEATVRRKIREGTLPATKPCGQYLVAEDDLVAFLEGSVVRSRPAPRSQRAEPTLPPPPTGRAPGGSFRSRRRREAA